MASIQDWVHKFEQSGSRGMRLVFVVLLTLGLLVCYNWRSYRNFGTQEAMDMAQVGRNIATGHGFSTQFIRPFSVHLVKSHNQERGLTSADTNSRPDFAQIKLALRHALIFDGRNLFEPERMRARGFQYYAIGRN